MLAFPWWQQKCSRVAARVAGVRSLSCRSGGGLGGSNLGLEYLVSGWGELLEAAEFVQVCSEVLAVPTGPVHPSRARREN